MSVTHIAGPFVGFKVQDRMIQRCCLCGAVLIDARPSRMSVPEGMDDAPPHFADGHLIQVEYGNPTRYSDLGRFTDPTVKLPDDFCFSLIEERTR